MRANLELAPSYVVKRSLSKPILCYAWGVRYGCPPVAQPRARGRVRCRRTSLRCTMLPFFLFCIYLTTNLGSLLLASAAQKKKTKFLAGLKVPASACRSPQRECSPRVRSLRPADGPPRPIDRLAHIGPATRLDVHTQVPQLIGRGALRGDQVRHVAPHDLGRAPRRERAVDELDDLPRALRRPEADAQGPRPTLCPTLCASQT